MHLGRIPYDLQVLLQSYVIFPVQQQLSFFNFEHKMKLFVRKYLANSAAKQHCQGKYEIVLKCQNTLECGL